jgi:hypothetical protein
VTAKDDAADRFHHVERCAEDGIVIAIEKHLGSWGVDRVEL